MLSRVMLVACEVAIELWMALDWSPQVGVPARALDSARCLLPAGKRFLELHARLKVSEGRLCASKTEGGG